MIVSSWNQIVELVKKHSRIFISLFVASIVLLGLALFLLRSQEGRIQGGVTPYSGISQENGRTVFSLTTQEEYLYKARANNGKDAALEFVKINPSFNSSPPLFPEDFDKNASITREEKDIEDDFLRGSNILITNEHYFFNQKINDIPVYNAAVVVHVRNSNEVYAATGNISTSKSQTTQQLSENDAMQIALQQAQEESGAGELKIKQTEKFYVNEKIIGLSDDTTNKIALRVEVESMGEPVLYRTDYLISLSDGKILYSESQVHDAIDRNIYNCQSGSCTLARGEGSGTGTDAEVNNLYTYFGDVYNFYSSTFGRDSYDDRGSTLKGYVHAPTGFTINGATMKCPNAFWNGYEMVFCTGLVLADVTAHELTHGVISTTARLQYMRQSGALNESIADIFGSAVDNNWDIGEGLRPGSGLPVPLRSMSNPPAQGNPDKLSSSLYHCGTSDNGGVHRNSGVINKTYYLMTDGGNYNGCSINGVGREKSIKVIYQALTKYLTATSNFKDAYAGIMQSCTDLYGSGSAECQNIDRAMQATELDQQTTGSVTSPICGGGSMRPATCAASGGAPTVPPVTTVPGTPTGTTGGPAPTPVEKRAGTWYLKATSINAGSVAHILYEYETPSGSVGSIATYEKRRYDALDPNLLGMADVTYGAPVADDQAKGQGTYTAKGNVDSNPPLKPNVRLDPPKGLKCDESYVVTLTDVTAGSIDPNGIPTTNNPQVLTINEIKTPPCPPSSTITPAGPLPTGAIPTPTPRQMFTCQPDPKCVQGKKNIQLCPLVCQPVAGSSTLPTPTGSGTLPTGTTGTTPTSSVPTTTASPTTASTQPTPTQTGIDLTALVNSVSVSNIQEYMQELVDDDDTPGSDETQTRYSGSQGLVVETNYVKNKLGDFGLVSSFQNFSFGSTNTRNVIGRIEGQDPNSVYLVTSHIDSTAQASGRTDPAPGANDNASGTVAVMEAARVLKSIQSQLKSSIEFVTFSGEEQGLNGSYYYVQNRPSGKTIKGVINMDMIGHNAGGACVNFLYKNYNGGDVISNKAVGMINRFNLGLGGISGPTSIGLSDHKPFWDVGIPAIFVNECTPGWTYYHTVNDKPAYINYSQIEKTTKAVVATIAELATN